MKYRFPSVMFVFSLPISSVNRVTELLRNFINTFRWIVHHQKGLTDGKYKGAKKLSACLFLGVTSSGIVYYILDRSGLAPCLFLGVTSSGIVYYILDRSELAPCLFLAHPYSGNVYYILDHSRLAPCLYLACLAQESSVTF